jgi:hypothetical protein
MAAYGSAGAPPQGIPGDAAIEFEMVVSAEKAPATMGGSGANVEDMFPSLDVDQNGKLDAGEV